MLTMRTQRRQAAEKAAAPLPNRQFPPNFYLAIDN
jgi:hypothetical protein